MKKYIYLDNNGTTERCAPAMKAFIKWAKDPINPSVTSDYGKASSKMINSGTEYIKKHCGAPNYTVLFTSGASESNCMIIRSTVEAYLTNKKKKPHIITSLTEHKSILDCCKSLKNMGIIEVTYIAPSIKGCVDPGVIKKTIRDNTALITIMAANNELGCINNYKEIGRIAHSHKIPFHSDFVQIFGKIKVNLPKNNIDAISVSFHKLHGPTGSGLLIINNDFINGYGLCAQIYGTQQDGLRGGTQNVPAIASSIAAMKYTFKNRAKKNARMKSLKLYILKELSNRFPFGKYESYFDKSHKKKDLELVLLGQTNINKALYSTILISVAKNKGKKFCNIKLKKYLNSRRIIVSVGSACNTKSKSASHVVQAIRAPDVIKQGIIRISLSDTTTKKNVDIFIKEFTKAIKLQL